jgi:hypothetical protein
MMLWMGESRNMLLPWGIRRWIIRLLCRHIMISRLLVLVIIIVSLLFWRLIPLPPPVSIPYGWVGLGIDGRRLEKLALIQRLLQVVLLLKLPQNTSSTKTLLSRLPHHPNVKAYVVLGQDQQQRYRCSLVRPDSPSRNQSRHRRFHRHSTSSRSCSQIRIVSRSKRLNLSVCLSNQKN